MTVSYDRTKVPTEELETRLMVQRSAPAHQSLDTFMRNVDIFGAPIGLFDHDRPAARTGNPDWH